MRQSGETDSERVGIRDLRIERERERERERVIENFEANSQLPPTNCVAPHYVPTGEAECRQSGCQCASCSNSLASHRLSARACSESETASESTHWDQSSNAWQTATAMSTETFFLPTEIYLLRVVPLLCRR